MRARRPEMCTPTILAAGHIKCAQAAIFVRTTGHFHARSRPFSVRVCILTQSFYPRVTEKKTENRLSKRINSWQKANLDSA